MSAVVRPPPAGASRSHHLDRWQADGTFGSTPGAARRQALSLEAAILASGTTRLVDVTRRLGKVSKYDPLWEAIRDRKAQSLRLSFPEIHDILGFEIDHSFLTFKKDLLGYGYRVAKISLKNQTVYFERAD